MTPLKVDTLFAEHPNLFAYIPPTHHERETLKVGDLVKFFFHLERFKHPRPIWFTVTQSVGLDTNRATAKLANMNYGEWARVAFPLSINFGVEHIYRLPLNRSEEKNIIFDPETRT